MKYTGPKARLCRRHGSNLYGSDKYDRVLQRKPYAPGKGPRARGPKKSEYASQLLEKQKVRNTFMVSERQFRRYHDMAQRSRESTGHFILRILELRLDNAIYRAGFAVTRMQARQMASHGLFFVNGRRSTVPSHTLKVGDVISARPRSANSPMFAANLEASEKYVPPSWIKADPSALSAEIISLPEEEHFEKGLDIQKVVELYSR